VANFEYWGMTVTDQILFHMEINKSGLNLGSAHCHSVQDILSFSCLKVYRLKLFETTVLPIVFISLKIGLSLQEMNIG
jgi:hypothetical protein